MLAVRQIACHQHTGPGLQDVVPCMKQAQCVTLELNLYRPAQLCQGHPTAPAAGAAATRAWMYWWWRCSSWPAGAGGRRVTSIHAALVYTQEGCVHIKVHTSVGVQRHGFHPGQVGRERSGVRRIELRHPVGCWRDGVCRRGSLGPMLRRGPWRWGLTGMQGRRSLGPGGGRTRLVRGSRRLRGRQRSPTGQLWGRWLAWLSRAWPLGSPTAAPGPLAALASGRVAGERGVRWNLSEHLGIWSSAGRRRGRRESCESNSASSGFSSGSPAACHVMGPDVCATSSLPPGPCSGHMATERDTSGDTVYALWRGNYCAMALLPPPSCSWCSPDVMFCGASNTT